MNYEKALRKLLSNFFHMYKNKRGEKNPDGTILYEGKVYTVEQFEKEIDDRMVTYASHLNASINRVKQ